MLRSFGKSASSNGMQLGRIDEETMLSGSKFLNIPADVVYDRTSAYPAKFPSTPARSPHNAIRNPTK